jgi:tRNA threonylcarbamoyladenosine biosynthesis protein TsaE
MPEFKPTFEMLLENEVATQKLANLLAHADFWQHTPLIIFLHGQLGAGKTCFVRYLLQALGVNQRVKSPTYSLVETYEIAGRNISHFDLYRVVDSSELEMFGIRDYLAAYDLLLIEWPQNGQAALPLPDLELSFTVVAAMRKVNIIAKTPSGELLLSKLAVVR